MRHRQNFGMLTRVLYLKLNDNKTETTVTTPMTTNTMVNCTKTPHTTNNHPNSATENMTDANEELRKAIQRNASLRVYILFFLL